MITRVCKKITVCTAVLSGLCATPVAMAQETLEEILERLDVFVEQENYPRALEELTWAQRALEKAHFARIDAFFPQQLQGLVSQKSERHEVLGVRMLTRLYGAASGNHLEVTLTDGPGKAGFAALEQFSRLFGMHGNAEPVRVHGLPGMLVSPDEQGNTTLSIQLESGASLRFEMPGEDRERVLDGAREFGIATLDEYLAGRYPAIKSNI